MTKIEPIEEVKNSNDESKRLTTMIYYGNLSLRSLQKIVSKGLLRFEALYVHFTSKITNKAFGIPALKLIPSLNTGISEAAFPVFLATKKRSRICP